MPLGCFWGLKNYSTLYFKKRAFWGVVQKATFRTLYSLKHAQTLRCLVVVCGASHTATSTQPLPFPCQRFETLSTSRKCRLAPFRRFMVSAGLAIGRPDCADMNREAAWEVSQVEGLGFGGAR